MLSYISLKVYTNFGTLPYYNNVSSIAFPDIPLKSISEIYIPLTRLRIPIFSLRFKVVFH